MRATDAANLRPVGVPLLSQKGLHTPPRTSQQTSQAVARAIGRSSARNAGISQVRNHSSGYEGISGHIALLTSIALLPMVGMFMTEAHNLLLSQLCCNTTQLCHYGQIRDMSAVPSCANLLGPKSNHQACHDIIYIYTIYASISCCISHTW